jgi:hypothetical protein
MTARPRTFKVWTELSGPGGFTSHQARTAIGAAAAEMAEMIDQYAANLRLDDDYLVQGIMRGDPVQRFRITTTPDDWQISRLRACRKCGCTDDRACEQGCAWVGPDKCSACFPIKGRRS